MHMPSSRARALSCPSVSIAPTFSPSKTTVLEPDLSTRVSDALELFSQIDIHDNGYITFDQLRAVMLRNAPGTDEEEIRSVYSSLAQDSDGTISKKAFIEGLQKFYGDNKDLDSGDGSEDDDDGITSRLDDGQRWAAGHVFEGLQKMEMTEDPGRRDSMEVTEDAEQLSQTLFKLLDKDGNGMLPVEELKQALSEIDSVMFSEDTLEDIISLLDDGETGVVTEEEFTEGFAILAAATSLDQLRRNIERFKNEKSDEQTTKRIKRRSLTSKRSCYSLEDDDCFTEIDTTEEMHIARVKLENRTAQLENELQQARAAAGKIKRRYSIVQKENQIQCEEKQRLAKQLHIAGTNARKLEENKEVYKKLFESTKLRLHRLEKKFSSATKEKEEMQNKLLVKQKQLEKELQNKQAIVEKAKCVMSSRGKEAKAKKEEAPSKTRIAATKILGKNESNNG